MMLKFNSTQYILSVVLPMAHTSGMEERLRDVLESRKRQTMMTRRGSVMMGLVAAAVLLPLAALHPAARAQAAPRRPSVRMTKANAAVSAVHAVPGEVDARLLLTQGKSLSPRAAAGLVRYLAAAPNDLDAHIRLLGYDDPWGGAGANRAGYDAQVFWLIQNHPESVLLGVPDTWILRWNDKEGFLRGEALWLAQVSKQPRNAVLLGKAASFCLLSDDQTAEQLLKRAAGADPHNPLWHSQLGDLYRRRARHASPATMAVWTHEAFVEYESAYLVDKATPFFALATLSDAAPDVAARATVRRYATDLLQRSESDDDWNSGIDSHYANIILGRLALQQGNITEAEQDLLAAGLPVGPPSPAINIFGGPDMRLARELLERGDRQSVLDYFAECAKFWTDDNGQLKAWTTQVQQGRVPDFSANLVY